MAPHQSTTPSADYPASPRCGFSRPGWTDSLMEDGMATVATDHYRAYTPRPFTRAERDSVTVLFGGLHWRGGRILLAGVERARPQGPGLAGGPQDDPPTPPGGAHTRPGFPPPLPTRHPVHILHK